MEIEIIDPKTGEVTKHKVNYYKPLTTESKNYNKVLIKSKKPQLSLKNAEEGELIENIKEEEDDSELENAEGSEGKKSVDESR